MGENRRTSGRPSPDQAGYLLRRRGPGRAVVFGDGLAAGLRGTRFGVFRAAVRLGGAPFPLLAAALRAVGLRLALAPRKARMISS